MTAYETAQTALNALEMERAALAEAWSQSQGQLSDALSRLSTSESERAELTAHIISLTAARDEWERRYNEHMATHEPEPEPDDGIPDDLTYSDTAGKANGTAAMQAILDDTGRLGIGPGVHIFTSPLLVDANTVIYLAPGARLLKRFSAAGAQRNAGIQNRRWGSGGPSGVTKVHDTTICGPGEYSAYDESSRGNLISLFGDRIVLREFKTTVWEGGRHTVLAGDDILCHDLDWRGGLGSTGNGGLRFQGGKNFRGRRIHCESGDDVFQFVPAGAPADPNYGMDIEDGLYEDCTGLSSHAKLGVIGLQFGGTAGDPDGVVSMTSSVRRCGFRNVHAPDGSAVTSRIQNISSSGVIEDCFIEDMTSKGYDTTTGGKELLINAYASTGGIKRLTVKNVRMLPFRQPMSVERGGEDTLFEDCSWARGTKAVNDLVGQISGTRTVLRRCTFDGRGSNQPVVAVVAPSSGGGPGPTDTRFEDCKVIGVNGVGIDFRAGTGTTVKGTSFSGTGQAMRLTGGARPALADNDYGTLAKGIA